MASFQKPENALKRAEELIAVGQRTVALEALEMLLKSKRHRTWQITMEKIMFKFVELCVELRQGKRAKEGLIQYRMICQQTNVGSLETVIKQFLSLAEDRAKAAQVAADKITLDVDDLEAEESPESIMLSSVSGEDSKERSDREHVTPWLKFLWETYRTVLEILRNNAKLESVYQDTAQQAFSFCLRYKRHTEFRRLCEILRNHLANITKYAAQPQNINLNSPESLQLHLTTRFAQLETATQLDLWQEAYRTIEDIHGLMAMSKKTPKSSMMATYYQKLSEIFWMSENYLFHAVALYKLWILQRNSTKIAQEDLSQLASSLILASLSVPLLTKKNDGTQMFDFDSDRERSLRMAGLLGFSKNPKREWLLSEVTSKNVVAQAFPELQQLHELVEVHFHPLEMAETVEPVLSWLKEHKKLGQYLLPLQRVLLYRLLEQLANVYQTMKISELGRLCPFLTLHESEKLIVEAVSHDFVHVRIDHSSGTLHFGSQALEADQLRHQLTALAKSLNKVVALIKPEIAAEKAKQNAEAYASFAAAVPREHQSILLRKSVIERRKEEHEREMQAAAEHEAAILAAQKKKEAETEAARLQEESDRRENERLEREERMRQELENRALVDQLEKQKKATKSTKKQKDDSLSKVDVTQMGEQDRAALVQEQRENLIKEKKDLEKRMVTLAKRQDHLERARREEEAILLKDLYEVQKVTDKEIWVEQQKTMGEQKQQDHANNLVQKARLSRMLADKNAYEKDLLERRHEEFEQMKIEHKKRLAEEREDRRQEKARMKEEARRKREKQEEEERMAELDRQRQEEEAIERRKEEERRAAEPPPDRRGPPREEAGRWGDERGGDKGGGWRGGDKGGYDDRGPPRRFDDRGPPRDGPPGGGWRGGDKGGFDDRGPPRGGDKGGYGGDRFGGDRGGDKGGYGGDRYGGDRGGDKGGYGGGGGGWRGGDKGGYDDRGPPRRFDDRGPPRDGPPGGGWRDREAARGGDKGGFDDRGPPRRFDDRGPPRDGPPGGGWREREAARGGDKGFSRDGPSRGGDKYGRDGPPPRDSMPPPSRGPPPAEEKTDDDGFTVVPKRGARR